MARRLIATFVAGWSACCAGFLGFEASGRRLPGEAVSPEQALQVSGGASLDLLSLRALVSTALIGAYHDQNLGTGTAQCSGSKYSGCGGGACGTDKNQYALSGIGNRGLEGAPTVTCSDTTCGGVNFSCGAFSDNACE
jgi:hypothetical protein